ncbi:MAG TPA: S-methyl-5'-thioadenosine phosphorylase [Spirochaetia bacterium]|nr:S-methyl-5'-thioadenosine phosphorylase [Spirochaetia bacterium]
MNVKAEIAIIGGSGLYQIEGVKVREELDIPTPFGPTSDSISICDIGGLPVAFLPRHGRGHRWLPTEVPSKANIWALKYLGVSQIIGVSAVGSLREEYRRGDFVICDQLIDRTRSRPDSYFGEGIVGHIGFADPYCPKMREALIRVIGGHTHPLHESGTLVCMEGPPFSTRAESRVYRSWNAHLIGMTALPEAKLAREAEICLALIAMVTDYDCWRESEEDVTLEMVLEVMKENTEAIKKMIPDLIRALIPNKDCTCRHAAESAIVTKLSLIPVETRRKLSLFYGKYWD